MVKVDYCMMNLAVYFVLFRDYLSPTDLIRNYPHLVVLGTGLAFGFLVVSKQTLWFSNLYSLLKHLVNLVYGFREE